jgi:Prokaryotic homologs of the JAB domain
MLVERMDNPKIAQLPVVKVLPGVLELIENEARHYEHSEQETGGILLAKCQKGADGDIVTIVGATGPGPSAFHHSVEFQLDTTYANRELERWQTDHEGVDFVGIWHKHPPMLARPSLGDYNSARQMLLDSDYTRHGLTRLINPIVVLREGKFIINFYYLDLSCKDFLKIPFETTAQSDKTYRKTAPSQTPAPPKTAAPSPKPPAKETKTALWLVGAIGLILLAVIIPLLAVLSNSSTATPTPSSVSGVNVQLTATAVQAQNSSANATQQANNQQLVRQLTVRAEELITAMAVENAILQGTPAVSFLPNRVDGFSLKVTRLSAEQYNRLLNAQTVRGLITQPQCLQAGSDCTERVLLKVSKDYLDYLEREGKPAQVNFRLNLPENPDGNAASNIGSVSKAGAKAYDPSTGAWFGVANLPPEPLGAKVAEITIVGKVWKSAVFEIDPAGFYLIEIS